MDATCLCLGIVHIKYVNLNANLKQIALTKAIGGLPEHDVMIIYSHLVSIVENCNTNVPRVEERQRVRLLTVVSGTYHCFS